jgi:transposase
MKETNITTQKDIKTMEQMVADLHLKLVESEKKHREHIKSKDTIISALHHQLFVLKNAKFGRKSEKLEEEKQLDLGFDEAELLSSQHVESDEIIETKTVTIKKKKPGRKPLPKSMPYIEHIHDRLCLRLCLNAHWQ